MKNKSLIFSLVAIFLVAGLAIYFGKTELPRATEKKDNTEIKYVSLGGTVVKVDLATTPEEREKGLSGREMLGENEGLLFVFETPGKYQFWMRDMNFPIDMIWIDSNFNSIVYIQKDATPESFPKAFGPGPEDGEATYVLEVPAGFSEKNSLKVGDRVGFQ